MVAGHERLQADPYRTRMRPELPNHQSRNGQTKAQEPRGAGREARGRGGVGPKSTDKNGTLDETHLGRAGRKAGLKKNWLFSATSCSVASGTPANDQKPKLLVIRPQKRAALGEGAHMPAQFFQWFYVSSPMIFDCMVIGDGNPNEDRSSRLHCVDKSIGNSFSASRQRKRQFERCRHRNCEKNLHQ